MSVFGKCTIAVIVTGITATLMPVSQTLVQRQQLPPSEPGHAPTPLTTAATTHPRLVGRRAYATCGYIDGQEPARCVNPYSCFYNDTASAAGCCSASDACTIPTACWPSTSSSPKNTDLTVHCSYSASPSCLTLIYGDGPCFSCTWFLCDSNGGRMAIMTSSSPGLSTKPPPTTPPPTRTTPKPTTTDPPPIPIPQPSPTGAIVGGTVGGVAALGAIGLLAFFLQRNRKSRASGSEQALAAEPQGDNGASQESRSKSETANMDVGQASPSPPSQYQQSFLGSSFSPSPAPVYPSSYLDQQVMPQQQFQGQQTWYPGPPQEMPITKPERPAHEMPADT